jgi:hypothetical protein
MAILLRYELKKLLSRKIVWIALGLCIVSLMWYQWSYITDRTSGYVAGIRYAYSTFEGRIATNALREKVKETQRQYILAHPQDFRSHAGESGVDYFPNRSGFSSGVQDAYDTILRTRTVEDWEEIKSRYEIELNDGYKEDGTPLSYSDYRSMQNDLADWEPTVIRYTEGWHRMQFLSGWGPLAMLLFLPGLTPLFAGETASRMDPILLCCVYRWKSVLCKMLAAVAFALMIMILFFVVQILLVACTYGLDGVSLPSSTLGSWSYGHKAQTIGLVYAKIGLVGLSAAVANAAVVSLASSLTRHSLHALLLGMTLIVAQCSAIIFAYGRIWWGWTFWEKFPWYYISEYLTYLPSIVLYGMNSDFLLQEPPAFPIVLGMTWLFTATCFALAYQSFLAPRRR